MASSMFKKKSMTASAAPSLASSGLAISPRSPLPINITSIQGSTSYQIPRSIVAAASVMSLSDKGEAERFKKRRSSDASIWQSEAWEYYDSIGEIKYAFNLVASVISRIKLYVGFADSASHTPRRVDDADPAHVSVELQQAALRALERLSSAYGGHSGLISAAALNLSVTGECYLVQTPARLGSNLPESWDIRSTDELKIDSRGNYTISPRRDIKSNASPNDPNGPTLLPSTTYVGRMWRSHARFSEEADSSMRGVLDLCSELLLLSRTYRATAHSRLNAGALYLPDGLAVAATPDPDVPYDDAEPSESITEEEAVDDFEEQLMLAMTTPIRQEDSASAVVPLLIRGPADLGEKIKVIKFERTFDPALTERGAEVLDRIMQGLDVPKDVVTGLANVKYANALQIDESLYKAHIEPLMLLIADSLTTMYLLPSLKASGFNDEQIKSIVIWYDPSAIATHNDKAADADTGFDKNLLSADAWRTAHGFAKEDAPTAEETALRAVLSSTTFAPEFGQALIEAIAPALMAKIKEAQQAASAAPLPPALSQALDAATPADTTDATTPTPTPTPTPATPDATTPTTIPEETPVPAPDAVTPPATGA